MIKYVLFIFSSILYLIFALSSRGIVYDAIIAIFMVFIRRDANFRCRMSNPKWCLRAGVQRGLKLNDLAPSKVELSVKKYEKMPPF